MEKLKAKWNSMDPKDQRKYMIGIIIGVLVVIAVILNNQREKDRQQQNQIKQNDRVVKTRIISPKVEEAGLEDLTGQVQSQVELQKREREELLAATKQLKQDTDLKTEALKNGYSELAIGVQQIQDEMRLMRLGQSGSPVNEVGGVKLPALEGIDTGANTNANSSNNQGGTSLEYNNEAIAAAGLTPNPAQAAYAPDQLIHPTPQPQSGLRVITKGSAENNSSGGQNSLPQRSGIMEQSKSREISQLSLQQRIEQSHILPTGSIIKGVLLSGMDAATGKGSSTPVPALIRIKHNAILPNRFSQNIRECFILASGVGELASHRALIRTEKISCIFKDGRVLDAPLSGYITGKSGTVGLRGRLVNKQGTYIARSVMASFLEGFGSSLKPSKRNSLDISNSSSSQYQQTQLSDALEVGSYDGISEGFNRVSEFYLNMAEQMFPIIEISAGTDVNVILTAPLNAKFTTVDGTKAANLR